MVVPVPELLEFLVTFIEEKNSDSRIVLSSIPCIFGGWAFAYMPSSTSVEDPEVFRDESENMPFKRLRILQYTFETSEDGTKLS